MIGETTFDMDRQRRFAELSGDHNPIHVDAIAVRRTLPGRLVVHGVQVLLWAIGVVSASFDGAPLEIARIRVRFLRFTHVGEVVAVVVTARSDEEIRLSVIGEGIVRAHIRLTFGRATAAATPIEDGETYPPRTGPLDHRVAPIDGRRGRVAFMTPRGALAADFPAAATWIGAKRIDALAAATRLVGMIYPGLHSVLGGVDIRLSPCDGAGALAFEMDEVRHGQIDATVSGGGIVGTLDCRLPNPPVIQPPSAALRDLVAPGRYAGARVLVIGGSRGAGEASAKLLALGGAEVTITYRDGADDAATVAADIAQAGGVCTVNRYDASEPAIAQLDELTPTHACWFATPAMLRQDLPLLDMRRVAECRSILIDGFFALAQALHGRTPDVRLFYPSSHWIDAPPVLGLTDYLMAKASGEVLARAIETILPRSRVFSPRLLPMATDQTARLGTEPGAAAKILLPHLDGLILGA